MLVGRQAARSRMAYRLLPFPRLKKVDAAGFFLALADHFSFSGRYLLTA